MRPPSLYLLLCDGGPPTSWHPVVPAAVAPLAPALARSGERCRVGLIRCAEIPDLRFRTVRARRDDDCKVRRGQPRLLFFASHLLPYYPNVLTLLFANLGHAAPGRAAASEDGAT